MKKIFLYLAALLCAMSLQAKTIYLKTTGTGWEDGGCNKFAVWYWNPGSGAWSDLMIKSGPGVWKTTVPDGQTQLVFARFSPSVNAPTWDTEHDLFWGKTCDQTIPSDNNMFTPTMNWGDGCYSGGTWSTYEEPEMVYYLAGSGFPNASWDAGSHLALTNNEISFENLSAGTYKFKITNNTWDFSLDAGSVDASCSTPGAYSGDSNGNITVILAGEGSISISVADGKICLTVVGETDEPYSGSAVPSECGDVLLQGFYYDSYEVDPHHNGTAEYGDTKWKTLLAQSGEIGAYFDLIWLPPSGYASGVGYHPKQYSNQNSDWGSRTDLEKLIAAFHNSGTKVVADIVINHAEGMTGWCDMATEDFGEYGVFEPGPSFITSNDEVNHPSTNVDTLAGDCWGYSAASRADDGANWEHARDWAHDNPEVQEMFKAYLKWMKNVMKYDGWRYDKGDGYSNWHMDNYNKASEPYIAFEEYYDGNAEHVKNAIRAGNMNMMAFDFPAKFDAINPIAGWNYVGRRGLIGKDDTGSDYWKKHAVTWVENHDMFLRDDNDLEFGGRNNSMTPAMKYRVLDANAFILSMPGVPCVFYPHWYKYKDEIKAMINARHLAGVHSESEVTNESWDSNGSRSTGYQATVAGKNGWLILCLGTKANQQGFGPDYQLVASGYHTFDNNGDQINESYEMWVHATGDVAPGIIATQSTTFEDMTNGIDVTIEAVGGSGAATIYYTTDGTDPTTGSSVYTTPLNFKETTTLKVMAVCGTAQSKVQEYTYTYREPLQRGIRVRFNKPDEWAKAYIYAWKEIITATDTTSEFLLGAYPGQRLYMDKDGWYSYEFSNDLESVKFQLSTGNDCGITEVKSNDLEANYDVCYGWRAGQAGTGKEEVELDCETELHPSFDLVITPETDFFRDQNEGVEVKIYAVGAPNAMIYYTTDGEDPTTASASAQGEVTFTVKATTTVKAYAVYGQDRTPTRTETYTYKAPQQGAITVQYMKPENWTDLYLYAFTRKKISGKVIDTPYSLDGNPAKWPGMKWTTKEGEWYTHTLPSDIQEIYVIFTEGKNKPQTQDIFLYETTCYLWNPDCRKAVVDANCDGVIEEGIEEIIANSDKHHEAYKLIIDGRLVIVNRGVMYDVMGRRL